MSGEHHAGGLNPPALANQHPIGIKQPDLPIAGERTIDLGGLCAGNPVDGNRTEIGLDELHPAARGYRKAAPVDDGFARRLGNDDT